MFFRYKLFIRLVIGTLRKPFRLLGYFERVVIFFRHIFAPTDKFAQKCTPSF